MEPWLTMLRCVPVRGETILSSFLSLFLSGSLFFIFQFLCLCPSHSLCLCPLLFLLAFVLAFCPFLYLGSNNSYHDIQPHGQREALRSPAI